LYIYSHFIYLHVIHIVSSYQAWYVALFFSLSFFPLFFLQWVSKWVHLLLMKKLSHNELY